MLTLIADATYPHLYRITYPDGWRSSLGNLTWAKDAAYGHARYSLMAEAARRQATARNTPSPGIQTPIEPSGLHAATGTIINIEGGQHG